MLFLFRFPDLLLFLQPAENIPEVVINKDFHFKIRLFDKSQSISKAVAFLKEHILEYSKQRKNDLLPIMNPIHQRGEQTLNKQA